MPTRTDLTNTGRVREFEAFVKFLLHPWPDRVTNNKYISYSGEFSNQQVAQQYKSDY